MGVVNSSRTRLAVLLAVVGVFLPGAQVRASDASRLVAALSAWDVDTARSLLAKGVDASLRKDLPLLLGTLHLLEGDSVKAEEVLAHATGPDVSRLRMIARGTRKVTKNLAIATSPSGRFQFLYRPGADEALLPYLIEAGDIAFGELERRLDMTVPTPVRVFVAPSFEDLASVTGLARADLDSSGAVAACSLNRIVMVSPARLPRGYPYADTLAHELVHYFLRLRAGDNVPMWLQEGMAKALESTWRGAPEGYLNKTLRQQLADAVVKGRLLPLASMGTSLSGMSRPEDTALAFAELASFAGWLMKTRGSQILPRLLDELTLADESVAVLRVTGRSIEALRSDWIASLAGNGAQVGPVAAGTGGVLLRETAGDPVPSLGPDAVAQYRLGNLLQVSGRPGAAAGKYRSVLETLSRPHPEVVARLAGALVDAGNPDAALAFLDESDVDEDEFSWVARERGRALVRVGRFAEAEASLETAIRSDPWDPEAHEALARVFGATGRADLAEREQRLANAWR